MTRHLLGIASLLFFASTTGCTREGLLDVAMQSAKHPEPHRGLTVNGRVILAGDLHCHVLPPDAPWHVSRTLPETVALATREGLDFAVLTPHVPSRFFRDPDARTWVIETQTELRASVAAQVRAGSSLIMIPGFEYTDHSFGHVGFGFADVRDVLAELSPEDVAADPNAFFVKWIARGGVLTINHPVQRPMHSVFWPLRWDLSWRGFAPDRHVPADYVWLTTHAQTVETFNLSITHLRDQFIVGDEERSLREASALVDHVSRAQGRRITPVGGTDSHGSWLRPTTFVLADARTEGAIRDAILAGRTCVRSPEACTLEAEDASGAWKGVGEAVTARGTKLRVRVRGDGARYLVDGAFVGDVGDGEVATLTIPEGRCSLVRAVVGLGWSAPIYVNCPFAR